MFHDGAPRTGGTIVNVDAAAAEHWARRGWASPVEDKPVTRRKAADQ